MDPTLEVVHVCRAADGEVFHINTTLRDIERTGGLEFFLHQETGVDQEAILAYLSNGDRLANSNISKLAASQDQFIFVFNKNYLSYDLDKVLGELRVEAPLQAPIEGDDIIVATLPLHPSQLATSYLNTAHFHYDHVEHMHSTLHFQHEAIRTVSSSLDINVLTIVDTFESIAVGARRELEKQASLLAGLEADLEIISAVKIHTEFMSPSVRKAIEGGKKHRTLGDFVSSVKMKEVGETCARTHDDLRSRLVELEQAVSRLTEGTDAVRFTVSTTSLLDKVEASRRRSQEIFDKISHATSTLDTPVSDPELILQELRQLDIALRNELQFITGSKNAYTEQCINALRRISILNNDMVQIPPSLSNLQAGFRNKNSFSHIQRLHNLLYAYGATVIEVVRRKEFARFFHQRAQSLQGVMDKLSASERKRRQIYRGDVYGQLPFETPEMDDPVPTIKFLPSDDPEVSYSLEREDMDGLLLVLDDLARSNKDPIALGAIRECRGALEKLIIKMDSLESDFDRIVTRSLLSPSRLSSSRGKPSEPDEQACQESASQHVYENLFILLMKESSSKQQSQVQRLRNTVVEAANSMKALDPVSRLVHCHQYRVQLLRFASDLQISDDAHIREALRKDEANISNKLRGILSSDAQKKAVLCLEGEGAQCLLNLIQTILDKGTFSNQIDATFSRDAHRLLVRLSEMSDILPTTLSITSVTLLDKEAAFGGGFADIYRALYREEKVALKRMRVFQRDNERHKVHRMICREALVWQHIKHPYVLPFLGIDSETFPPFLCLVSPWMEHGTILKHMVDNGNVNIDQRIYEIAQGLEYLHSQHIIHGDLRGANVLIDSEWHARIADFGLTVLADGTAATHTSNSSGSARWMAPELHDPESFGFSRFQRTRASDVYAFACTCLEVYTGSPPFLDILNDSTVMLKVMSGGRPERPLDGPGRATSNDLWSIIVSSWSQQPSERPSMNELVKSIKILCPRSMYIGLGVDTKVKIDLA